MTPGGKGCRGPRYRAGRWPARSLAEREQFAAGEVHGAGDGDGPDVRGERGQVETLDADRERDRVDDEPEAVHRRVPGERAAGVVARPVVRDRPVEDERPGGAAHERQRAGQEVRHRREDEDDGVHDGAGGTDDAELDRPDRPRRGGDSVEPEQPEDVLGATFDALDDARHSWVT